MQRTLSALCTRQKDNKNGYGTPLSTFTLELQTQGLHINYICYHHYYYYMSYLTTLYAEMGRGVVIVASLHHLLLHHKRCSGASKVF